MDIVIQVGSMVVVGALFLGMAVAVFKAFTD